MSPRLGLTAAVVAWVVEVALLLGCIWTSGVPGSHLSDHLGGSAFVMFIVAAVMSCWAAFE
jgi:hypothetical protein